MQEAELRAGYQYLCEVCGDINFVENLHLEVTDELDSSIREEADIHAEATYSIEPGDINCLKCGSGINEDCLQDSYVWCCGECGKDNILIPELIKLSEEEISKVGLDSDWLAYRIPNVVSCIHCHSEFEPIPHGKTC